MMRRLAFPVFLAVIIIAGIFGAQLAVRDPQKHAHNALDKMLWRPVEAYNFRLTDHNGRKVELRDFRGQTVVFAFGFTHCPSICPATLSHLTAIKEALPPGARDKVRFLFVSLDPPRDTPERLREFVTFYDPDFLGLTGDLTELKAMAYKYKASWTVGAPAPGDPQTYNLDHTADLYVIDPEGTWVMAYPFEELPEAKMIAGEIARTLETK
jgi:protein SCO1/2